MVVLTGLAESRDHVAQKARGIVVTFVYRKPGNASLHGADPLLDKGRFAKAWRRGDQRQAASQA
jgi:hypothetical protein